ncbi:MAG: DUF475 domain-containing protein [Deinococcales bacterium]
MSFFKDFGFSIVVSVICLTVATWYGYWEGGASAALSFFLIAAILGIMELSLSFDNAVINATVLRKMSPIWQRRFLTWGILIAVFGMRFIFPIVIVALVAKLDFIEVIRLAFQNPDVYAHHLEESTVAISAFGGSFLALVALKYLMNPLKDLHWFVPLEKRLSQIGRLDTIQVFLTGSILLALVSLWVYPEERLAALSAGLVGILIYILIDSITGYFDLENTASAGLNVGLSSFIYLELLDASFSLDGVIGAFAITKDVVVIAAGLTIGAVFVRSLTLLLVKRGTLQQYLFLEHGAHYGIAALAIIMLLSMNHEVHIPEVITGLIGLAFILASLWSSFRYRQQDHSQNSKAH